jgi:hypothetical protein
MHKHVGFEEKSILLQFFNAIDHLGEMNNAALPISLSADCHYHCRAQKQISICITFLLLLLGCLSYLVIYYHKA